MGSWAISSAQLSVKKGHTQSFLDSESTHSRHVRCKERFVPNRNGATWTTGTKSCSAPLCKASPPEFRSLCLPIFFWCFYSRLVPGELSWRMLWECCVLQNLPLKLGFCYTANNSIWRKELSWLAVSGAFRRRESLHSCALLVLEW